MMTTFRISLMALCLLVAGVSPAWAQATIDGLEFDPAAPLFENGSAVYDVIVGNDPDGSAVVTVSGSDPALSPDTAFVVTKVAADRHRVVFRPTLDMSGSTTLTFLLSDPAPLGNATLNGVNVVAATAVPRPPTSLTGAGPVQATLAWTEPAAGAVSDLPSFYLLEIGDAPGMTSFAPMRIPARTPGVLVSLPQGGYNFRLRPGNRAGLGAASADGSVGLAAGANVPGPPAGLGITLSPSNVATVTWAAPAFGAPAVGYVLEVGTATGQSDFGRFPLPPTMTLSAGVGPGTYFVRMRGVGAAGEGPASPEVVLTVPSGPCQPPAAPVLSTLLRNGQYLMAPWSVPVTGQASGYALSAGTTPGAADIITIPLPSTTSLFAFAPPAGTYHVFVQATSSCGVSGPSNVMTYVEPAPAVPGAPQGLSATTGPGAASFNWNPPVTGSRVESYVLEAGFAPGQPLFTFPLPSLPGISFTSVPAGNYFVRIRATNALGTSVPSNEIALTIP